MNALRHPLLLLLSVLLVLQLLYRYSTATVLLLRHGSSVGTHHTKNNNNNNHVPQQLQQQLPVSKQISKQKRRNIKHKKPKGSKYYHLENDNDDSDNDKNDDTVDVDMYNSTTDGKLSIPVSDSNNSTTTSNNTTNTIIVTSPSSSPPTTTTTNTTTTSSVDASTRKSYGSSTATIKKQTMKKNMDPSKKDKLTKTKTMFTTSTDTTGSKGDHPTQSPQTESIDSNVKGDNRSKKGDTNKQMNPKGKKEHTYFVERTRTPTTTAPMIPVVSVPAPSSSVVQPHSNTGRTNRPTKVPTTITTFVPVAYNNSNLTFAPIPPPSTITNTTTNDTTAVTTTPTNTTTSGRTNVTMTNARNGDESRHSNSSAIDVMVSRRNHSVSAAAIVPDTYLDRTTGLFRHTADP